MEEKEEEVGGCLYSRQTHEETNGKLDGHDEENDSTEKLRKERVDDGWSNRRRGDVDGKRSWKIA